MGTPDLSPFTAGILAFATPFILVLATILFFSFSKFGKSKGLFITNLFVLNTITTLGSLAFMQSPATLWYLSPSIYYLLLTSIFFLGMYFLGLHERNADTRLARGINGAFKVVGPILSSFLVLIF